MIIFCRLIKCTGSHALCVLMFLSSMMGCDAKRTVTETVLEAVQTPEVTPETGRLRIAARFPSLEHDVIFDAVGMKIEMCRVDGTEIQDDKSSCRIEVVWADPIFIFGQDGQESLHFFMLDAGKYNVTAFPIKNDLLEDSEHCSTVATQTVVIDAKLTTELKLESQCTKEMGALMPTVGFQSVMIKDIKFNPSHKIYVNQPQSFEVLVESLVGSDDNVDIDWVVKKRPVEWSDTGHVTNDGRLVSGAQKQLFGIEIESLGRIDDAQQFFEALLHLNKLVRGDLKLSKGDRKWLYNRLIMLAVPHDDIELWMKNVSRQSDWSKNLSTIKRNKNESVLLYELMMMVTFGDSYTEGAKLKPFSYFDKAVSELHLTRGMSEEIHEIVMRELELRKNKTKAFWSIEYTPPNEVDLELEEIWFKDGGYITDDLRIPAGLHEHIYALDILYLDSRDNANYVAILQTVVSDILHGEITLGHWDWLYDRAVMSGVSRSMINANEEFDHLNADLKDYYTASGGASIVNVLMYDIVQWVIYGYGYSDNSNKLTDAQIDKLLISVVATLTKTEEVAGDKVDVNDQEILNIIKEEMALLAEKKRLLRGNRGYNPQRIVPHDDSPFCMAAAGRKARFSASHAGEYEMTVTATLKDNKDSIPSVMSFPVYVLPYEGERTDPNAGICLRYLSFQEQEFPHTAQFSGDYCKCNDCQGICAKANGARCRYEIYGDDLKQTCVCTRKRKALHNMTDNELTTYIDTFLQAWYPADESPDVPSELQELVADHVTFFSRGLHNNGAFLPWHRGYILAAENALQDIDCSVTVPYWDWSNHQRKRIINDVRMWGNDDYQFSGDGRRRDNCVELGQFGYLNGFSTLTGQCLRRNISGGEAAGDAEITNLICSRYRSPSQYDAFRNRLEHGPGLNDSVHCIVGGTMCSARSSNDPVFFSHHANIDRLWNEWQSQSDAHRDIYVGQINRDETFPQLMYTPKQMLNIERLPGDEQSGTHPPYLIKVVYDADPICSPPVREPYFELACGGLTGAACLDGFVCTDDTRDNCEPNLGHRNCQGRCLRGESCKQPEDCSNDDYCRSTGVGDFMECVSPQLAGEPCNINYDRSHVEAMLCDKSLTCVVERPVRCDDDSLKCTVDQQDTDLTGVCRKQCDENGKCDTGEYCSANLGCIPNDVCLTDIDCIIKDNGDSQNILAKCDDGFGTGRCVYNRCEYDCRDHRCSDLQRVDLDVSCDTKDSRGFNELGYGILWGQCLPINACNERFKLLQKLTNGRLKVFDGDSAESDCNAKCTSSSPLPVDVVTRALVANRNDEISGFILEFIGEIKDDSGGLRTGKLEDVQVLGLWLASNSDMQKTMWQSAEAEYEVMISLIATNTKCFKVREVPASAASDARFEIAQEMYDDDNDTCNECTTGLYDVCSDGFDMDGDGICDAGDPDDDNDGILDVFDSRLSYKIGRLLTRHWRVQSVKWNYGPTLGYQWSLWINTNTDANPRGYLPGPTLKMNVGDIADITLHNEIHKKFTHGGDLIHNWLAFWKWSNGVYVNECMSNMDNFWQGAEGGHHGLKDEVIMHWHGIELANCFDGTPVTQFPISHNDTYSYRFRAVRPGVFWYHPHWNSIIQNSLGLNGAIIVEDDEFETLRLAESIPDTPRTFILSLRDIAFINDPNDSTAYLPYDQSADDHVNIDVSPSSNASVTSQYIRDTLNSGGGKTNNWGDIFIVNGKAVDTSTGVGAFNTSDNKVTSNSVMSFPYLFKHLNNGKVIEVAPGDGLAFYLINAGLHRYYRIKAVICAGSNVAIEDIDFEVCEPIDIYRLGGEGGLLMHARRANGQFSDGTNPGYYFRDMDDRDADKFAPLPGVDEGAMLIESSRTFIAFKVPPTSTTGTVYLLANGFQLNSGWADDSPDNLIVAKFNINNALTKKYPIDDLNTSTALLAHPSVPKTLENLADGTIDGIAPAGDTITHGYNELTIKDGLGHAGYSLSGLPSLQTDFNITLDKTPAGPAINDEQVFFTDAGPGPLQPVNSNTKFLFKGDVVEFNVANLSNFTDHPWHPHGFSFQPIKLQINEGTNEAPDYQTIYEWDFVEYMDVFNIPANHQLIYRFRVDDRSFVTKNHTLKSGGVYGRWLMHCHIFRHAHKGMMADMIVLPEDHRPHYPCHGDDESSICKGAYFDPHFNLDFLDEWNLEPFIGCPKIRSDPMLQLNISPDLDDLTRGE